MAERALPRVRSDQRLGRRHAGCRTDRFRILIATGSAAITALFANWVWPPRPLLVWNASASAPVGLYYVSSVARAARGAMVVAWLPEWARQLGAERHYLPLNVPLVKRVAAVAGDRVCAADAAIFVNGRLAARRRTRDPSGRPMPWWTGCEDISAGNLFLLTPGMSTAFDGRYFGVTRRRQIVGRATLVWRG